MPCIKTTPKHIVSSMCTELDDSNPLETSCSSTSAVFEPAKGSTTTVDHIAEATEGTPPSLQSKEKVQSAQSVDNQGMY